MARPRRFQYPGAVYHVMARGDGGKTVFENDDDRLVFLSRLGEVCGSCGWRVHAWVFMGNHFHLLLETPLPNLVAGMKWLLGTFSQGWNRARKRQGHVFQGRYKSVPVNGSDADRFYLGEETFRDRLLDLVEKAKGVKPRQRRKAAGLEKDHGEKDAARIVRELGPKLGLPTGVRELAELRKGDERKALLAAVLRRLTAVATEWIAQRLAMGHPGCVSRQVGIVKSDRKLLKKLNEHGKMFHCGD